MAEEKEKPKKNKRKSRYRGLKIFIVIQLALMALVFIVLGWYHFGGYAKKVSELRSEAIRLVEGSTVETFRQAQTSVAYDVGGNIIATLKGEKDVYYLPIAEIPEYVKQAAISIEDKKFYSHHGFDFAAIVRAVIAMIKNGHVSGGASTITQQLARNIFLTNEKTWERKVEEIYIAVELEKKYSKDEILEFYLNNIYFANGNYGIESASEGYFSKEASKLTLSEAAYLIAIPNRPEKYDPLTHHENTLERRNRILENMLNDKVISERSYNEALASPVKLNVTAEEKHNYLKSFMLYCATRELMKEEGFEFRNDFFSEDDKKAYETAYGEKYAECNAMLFTGGYRIYTSLDLSMQNKLQAALDTELSISDEKSEDGVFSLQGAAACIDNSTGFVKAIVGGRSQDLPGTTLNRAYQSMRQPGSAIKPLLVYTPALEGDYTAESIVVDEEIEDGPANSDGVFEGEITLRYAVERSKNTIAWKIFSELTPDKGFEYLSRLGFYGLDRSDHVPAASIGGFRHGVSALEMAKAYCAIENDGNARDATCVIKITDAQGRELYFSDRAGTEVYKESAARQMTDILEGVMINGTAAGYGLDDQACAGKTGTTTDNKDGWFVGYTRYYTTAVWVGFDMPRQLEGLGGATYPARIWYDFMNPLHEGLKRIEFLDPKEIKPPRVEDFQDEPPENSGTSQEIPEMPENPEIPENPENLPATPDNPEVPENPDVPGNPETPPEEPEIPPGNPETPSDNPENPEMPENSEIPGTSEILPDNPETPENPQEPGNTDTQPDNSGDTNI